MLYASARQNELSGAVGEGDDDGASISELIEERIEFVDVFGF